MKYPLTAKRIKDAMESKGIIAQELAARSGVNKSSISQYVNGSHTPSNLSAGKMAEVLSVDPAWLMGFSVNAGRDLSDQENELLRLFRLLNTSGRAKVLEDIADTAALPKYTNKKSSFTDVG